MIGQVRLRQASLKFIHHPTQHAATVLEVCAFAGSFLDLNVVPTKWRYLVPPTMAGSLQGKREPLACSNRRKDMEIISSEGFDSR